MSKAEWAKLAIRSPNGLQLLVTLSELESALSPVLFLFPEREGAIVPIKRSFANDLLGNTQQGSLLPLPEAILMSERSYFSDPRTLSTLGAGKVLLFYESSRNKGRASVVAAARILETSLVPKEEVGPTIIRRGVLDKGAVSRLTSSKEIAVTTFDNILPMGTPVGLKRLRQLGCVDGANLVTARRLSADQMIEILKDGRPND